MTALHEAAEWRDHERSRLQNAEQRLHDLERAVREAENARDDADDAASAELGKAQINEHDPVKLAALEAEYDAHCLAVKRAERTHAALEAMLPQIREDAFASESRYHDVRRELVTQLVAERLPGVLAEHERALTAHRDLLVLMRHATELGPEGPRGTLDTDGSAATLDRNGRGVRAMMTELKLRSDYSLAEQHIRYSDDDLVAMAAKENEQ